MSGSGRYHLVPHQPSGRVVQMDNMDKAINWWYSLAAGLFVAFGAYLLAMLLLSEIASTSPFVMNNSAFLAAYYFVIIMLLAITAGLLLWTLTFVAVVIGMVLLLIAGVAEIAYNSFLWVVGFTVLFIEGFEKEMKKEEKKGG